MAYAYVFSSRRLKASEIIFFISITSLSITMCFKKECFFTGLNFKFNFRTENTNYYIIIQYEASVKYVSCTLYLLVLTMVIYAFDFILA